MSFSSEFSESLSNSEVATYPIPDGESGYVVWTSYVRCSEGTCSHGHTRILNHLELIREISLQVQEHAMVRKSLAKSAHLTRLRTRNSWLEYTVLCKRASPLLVIYMVL